MRLGNQRGDWALPRLRQVVPPARSKGTPNRRGAETSHLRLVYLPLFCSFLIFSVLVLRIVSLSFFPIITSETSDGQSHVVHDELFESCIARIHLYVIRREKVSGILRSERINSR